MGLFDRLKSFVFAPAPASVSQPNAESYGSPYESANYSSKRARVPGSGRPRDFKHDLTPDVRDSITEKTRYANKNSGIFRGVSVDMKVYSVGDGITVQSNSPAPESKRKAALKAWNRWCKRCEITGRFSFAECQRMISIALDVDGEIFVVKVLHPDTNEPLIQLIESHRCGDFGNAGATRDGIAFDKHGAPVFYRFIEDDGSVKDVAAAQVLHIFDPESPSMSRATSPLQHGANHILDEQELLALEKHAVKVNSDAALVITTGSGNLDDGEEGDFKVTTEEEEAEGSDPKAIQKITGGKVVTLAAGEDFESFESKRPSPTFNGFITTLRRDAVNGALPYEFTADPSDVGGAGVRLVVTKADRMFSMRQGVIINRCIEAVWFFVIGTKIERREIAPFADWWEISCVTPRKITTDAARDSAANRADVEMGLKCLGDHFAENGTTFEAELERRAQEAKAILAMADKYNVPVEMLFKPSSPYGTPESGTPPTTKPAKRAEER
jgi:capsid protein